MNNLDKFFTDKFQDFSKSYFNYLEKIFSTISHQEIENLVNILIEKRKENANIFFIGNGGSASTASHFANDIAIGTKSSKNPFKAISLTDNQAIITAIGNDYGFEYIFSKQIETLGKENDLLIAISASGNSPNLIQAIDYCHKKSINTFSLTSFDGGKLKTLAENNIHIKTELKEYGPAEDLHMILAGLIGSYLIRYVLAEN
tara:strand:- start:2381 stop:2986 length:606 start_codon:yes stop_codon:yes gene_type:complete